MSDTQTALKPAPDLIVELDPNLIDPCPWQQRGFTKADDVGLKELGANIKAVGQEQPITVRPHPDQRKKARYQLLNGERRVRACRFAGISVRAVVRAADDTGAMVSCFVENYMRKNLAPLEEAAGFQTLLDGENGKAITKKELAERLGINPMRVTRRTQLLNLTPQWRKRLNDPERGYIDWPASIMEYLSKFPPVMQEEIASEIQPHEVVGMTLDELRDAVARWIHELKSAPFKLDDETFPHSPACVNCQKRSSHEPDLFDPADFGIEGDGKVPVGDRCLEVKCYDEKLAAHVKRREAELRAEHPGLLLVGDTPSDVKGHVVLRHWDFNECKKSTQGALPCFYVDGPKAGQLAWMKPRDSFGSTASAAASEPGKPKPLAERRKQYDKRRQVHVLDQLIAMIEEDIEEDIKRFEHLEWPDLLAFSLVMGRLENAHREWADRGKVWKDYEATRKAARVDERAVVARLFFLSLDVLAVRMRELRTLPDMAKRPELEYGCKILGLKLPELEKAAADEIPYPKSWDKLKADGTPKAAKANGKKDAPKKTSGHRGMIKTAA